jgi:hypothetical protein
LVKKKKRREGGKEGGRERERERDREREKCLSLEHHVIPVSRTADY